MSNATSTGNEGCPCIDASEILSTLEERFCQTESGERGVLLAPEMAACVPLYYGSNACLQHDMLYSPECQGVLDDSTAFCLHRFCYVDAESCKYNSHETLMRSDYFGRPPLGFGDTSYVNLFYSYTTCNSSPNDWETYKADNLQDNAILGGASLLSLMTDVYPFGYKRNADGEVWDASMPGYQTEMHNASVPYEGILVDYVNDLIRISNGDIMRIYYTEVSNAAKIEHPTSVFNAMIQDVAYGLVDMTVAPLWITGERLKMTAFTVPLLYDKTVLVVQKPGSRNTFKSEAKKVWQPFKPGLWILIVVIILTASLLSVWFTDHKKEVSTRSKSVRKLQEKRGNKVRIYARLALDSILQKGMFFCGAAVEQDEGHSLSNKLLLFGFAFFILITVSAYVANLAAFLTRPSEQFVGTVAGVIKEGKKICAHPVLKDEMKIKWPDASFVFHASAREFRGVVEDYDAGKCDVLAVGREDTMLDGQLMEMFCQRDLVFTDSIFLETPIAFAVRPELASGLSYWILEGEKYHGSSVDRFKRKYLPEVSCSVELNVKDEDIGDYAQISLENMLLPTVIFIAFACMAIIVRVWQRKKKIAAAGGILLQRALTRQPTDAGQTDAKGGSGLTTNNTLCIDGHSSPGTKTSSRDTGNQARIIEGDENKSLISFSTDA